MIARWFLYHAELAGTALTELSLFGTPLIFAGNGALFRPGSDPSRYEVLCLYQEVSEPTQYFYRDVYLDDDELDVAPRAGLRLSR